MGTGKDISTIFNLMPPLGIMSIAAFLEARGIDTEIIDCYGTPLTGKDLADEIIRRRPDGVGFSCTTSSFLEGYRIAELLKGARPDLPVVFGGAHACSVGMSLLDSFPAIDYLVLGEGEQTMFELAAAGFRNGEAVPGVAFRKDGQASLSDQRSLIVNLDDLPFPAYRRLLDFPRRYNLPLFSYPTAPNTSIISSRGCPYNCSYCDRSVFSRGFRFNSPDYITDHMFMLNRDFGIRHVFFYDDLFTFDRKRVAEFCELKERKRIPVTYNCIADRKSVV